MKLLIISKAPIQNFPRIFSLIFASIDLGYEVEVVTQNIIKESQILLEKYNVKVYSIENKTGGIRKIMHWLRFANFANKIYRNADSNTKIWITGADTAMCMGINTLKTREFYFQINELYDQFPFQLRWIKKIVPHAKEIIVPEKNRAAILQVWFNMKSKPLVLPNKPYFEDNIIASGEEKYLDKINLITEEKKKGKIILLYQGHLSKDRDLSNLLIGVHKSKDIFSIILMGKAHHDILQEYKKLCPELIYIDNIPAPYHLNMTKHADIGIILYSPVSLNNIYCAPNKVWEYTKHGLAIISNDIIGLDYISRESIGEQFDLTRSSSVNIVLSRLAESYKSYKNNSSKFYNTLDFKENLKVVLK